MRRRATRTRPTSSHTSRWILAFKSNGYLASIRQVKDADGHVRNIDIGDYVTQGTVLATVQEDDFKDKLAQAKASLERSQAENETREAVV